MFSFSLPSWLPIHEWHKLIKTADWNKDGWLVVDECEFGHVASGSEKRENLPTEEKKVEVGWRRSTNIISVFVVSNYTSVRFPYDYFRSFLFGFLV